MCSQRNLFQFFSPDHYVYNGADNTSFLTNSAAHEELAAMVKSTHWSNKFQECVSLIMILSILLHERSWIPHSKAEYCSHNPLLFTGQDLRPILVLKKDESQHKNDLISCVDSQCEHRIPRARVLSSQTSSFRELGIPSRLCVKETEQLYINTTWIFLLPNYSAICNF